jgi:hypothetical protein
VLLFSLPNTHLLGERRNEKQNQRGTRKLVPIDFHKTCSKKHTQIVIDFDFCLLKG